MPRPQKVTDEEILASVSRVMQRVDPGDLTLGAVANEAGVTPGLLVQRFGSKHALLVRLAARAAGTARAYFRDLRAIHDSPLATLRAYVVCFADLAASPEAFARNLAYLTADLTDHELRVHLARQSQATRSEIEALLTDAVKHGELERTANVKRLGRTIEAVITGSMITWATYRVGKADRWMRGILDAVLEPYTR
jgi:AcrR family transcriptional regulator